MSIEPQASTLTTMPSTIEPAPTPAPANTGLELSALFAWTAIGLLVAFVLGAFRKRSIAGPDRLLPSDSAWDLIIILCISFFVTMLAAFSVSRVTISPQAKILLENGVGEVAGSVTIIFLLIAMRPGQLTHLGTNPKWIPAGLAGGAATLFVLYPLILLTGIAVSEIYEHFHQSPPGAHELLQLLGNSQSRGFKLATVLLAAVAAPVTEELTYRALLQTALGRAFAVVATIRNRHTESPVAAVSNLIQTKEPIHAPTAGQRWAAVIVTAIIFAAIHMNIAFFFPIFVLAIGLGYIYERTGNLWITIVAHGLFNGGQIISYLASAH